VSEFFQTKDFEEIMPVYGSVEGVDILSQEHELTIITSRPNNISEKAEKWIEKYYPNKFSDIYMTNSFSLGGNCKYNFKI